MENNNDYINKLFSLEEEMLLSIESYIAPETKKKIIDKIRKQKDILMGIVNTELEIQEKIKRSVKPTIDDNYFDKKPLNINNI